MRVRVDFFDLQYDLRSSDFFVPARPPFEGGGGARARGLTVFHGEKVSWELVSKSKCYLGTRVTERPEECW